MNIHEHQAKEILRVWSIQMGGNFIPKKLKKNIKINAKGYVLKHKFMLWERKGGRCKLVKIEELNEGKYDGKETDNSSNGAEGKDKRLL